MFYLSGAYGALMGRLWGAYRALIGRAYRALWFCSYGATSFDVLMRHRMSSKSNPKDGHRALNILFLSLLIFEEPIFYGSTCFSGYGLPIPELPRGGHLGARPAVDASS